MRSFRLDPDALLDFKVDWAAWLQPDETITASEWDVPDGITSISESATDTDATVWLSGGTDGDTYVVTNRVTTSAGRTDDRSFRVIVTNR